MGSLWPYHKDIANDNIVNSESFKFKARITGRAPADGHTKNIEIVSLKYLIKFWRTLEIPLINYKINPQLTWSGNCIITNLTGIGALKIMNTRLCSSSNSVDSTIQNYYNN